MVQAGGACSATHRHTVQPACRCTTMHRPQTVHAGGQEMCMASDAAHGDVCSMFRGMHELPPLCVHTAHLHVHASAFTCYHGTPTSTDDRGLQQGACGYAQCTCLTRSASSLLYLKRLLLCNIFHNKRINYIMCPVIDLMLLQFHLFDIFESTLPFCSCLSVLLCLVRVWPK